MRAKITHKKANITLDTTIEFVDEVRGVPLSIQKNDMQISAFAAWDNGVLIECLALHIGLEQKLLAKTFVPVRIQSACVTSEVFGSDRCDCCWQLDHALTHIRNRALGVLIYIPAQEGRGSGLVAKIQKFLESDGGKFKKNRSDGVPFPADVRSYRVAMQVIKRFGISKLQLITNNPDKLACARINGFTAVKRIPSVMRPAPPHIRQYLTLKRNFAGHLL